MAKEDFISFYKKNLNLSSDEFDRFIEVMETKLPQTFRIIDSPFYSEVKRRVEKMGSIVKLDHIRDTYSIDKDIEETEYNKEFIINQTLIGTIQRQEIVSMIPISLMGLKKDHYVLDLCAAPGSKTKQVLNIVGEDGLIIANDQSSKRLNVLITETCKIPHESFIVTQHDASKFPSINMSKGKKFDRILCDVPCSSDGTIRKNPALLVEWNVQRAQDLFDLQYRILKRSVDLIGNEGVIVYSTCSLNPIENECIIQNIVLNEDMEVIDPLNFLDNDHIKENFLIRRGLKSWDVGDFKHKYLYLEPSKEDVGFGKCIRMYPHDFNTGGFFIALLRKKSCGKNKKEILKTNPKPLYKDLNEAEKIKILDNYKLDSNINLTRRYNANNVLYRISNEVRHIIHCNRLKIVYAGCKAFEKCNISETGYRIKNTLYQNGIYHDFELSLDQLKGALINKTLEQEYEKKSVILKIRDVNVYISGYSTGKKIMLYVCNNLQKALLDFTNKD